MDKFNINKYNSSQYKVIAMAVEPDAILTATPPFSGTVLTQKQVRQFLKYYPTITNLTISEGVTTIGMNAFAFCVGLTRVDFPASLQTIGAQTFGGCMVLEALSIPVGVTTIGERAFNYCMGLTVYNLNLDETLFTGANKIVKDYYFKLSLMP